MKRGLDDTRMELRLHPTPTLPLSLAIYPPRRLVSFIAQIQQTYPATVIMPGINILILGSGMVAPPCVKYLLRNEKNKITVGKLNLSDLLERLTWLNSLLL